MLYALQVNNRLDGYLGDIRAQIGAAKQAADDLVGLVERYGVDMIESAVDHMIDYAAKRFAEEVSAWPDGVYEGDAYVDHDPLGNPDIHLHVKITVDGPKLTIDYTGSDERQELQSWSTYGNTRGYTVAPDRRHDGPRDPQERGVLQLHRADRAPGVRDESPPGQAGLGGDAPPRRRRRRGHRRRAVGCAARPGGAPDLQDRDPDDHPGHRPPQRGQSFVDGSAEVYAGWCNAAKGMDAWGAVSASFGNLWKATAEINESPLPAHPVEPGLPDRLGRRRAVARRLWLALHQGGAGPLARVHLRGRA